jgi:cyclopropane fatty-acyl-phospholipid synthase-like methyltransferase
VEDSTTSAVLASRRVPRPTRWKEPFDGIVAFYSFNHVSAGEVAPAFAAAFECLRPGGYLLLAAIPAMKAEDRVEEWLDVPMFFAGIEPGAYERDLRKLGFRIEMSEIRFATQERWGLSEPLWIIARKPATIQPACR